MSNTLIQIRAAIEAEKLTWTGDYRKAASTALDCALVRIEHALAAIESSQCEQAHTLDYYAAGMLNDYGGGNVAWWHAYICAELGRAHDFYQAQVVAPPAPDYEAMEREHFGDPVKKTGIYCEQAAPAPQRVLRDASGEMYAIARKSCASASEVGEQAQPSLSQPELTVWYGPMPESNGKSNFTAILMRKNGDKWDNTTDGHTIDRSEYPDRVRYEADRVRYLIGELDKQPWILDYDADKHSGYVAVSQPVAPDHSGEAAEMVPACGDPECNACDLVRVKGK